MSADVITILFGFSQAVFFGEDATGAVADLDATFEALKKNRTLRAETAIGWAAPARAGLREILTAWISVLQLATLNGNPVRFPASFLDGSSSTRLGPKIVSEILRREADLRSLAPRIRQAKR